MPRFRFPFITPRAIRQEIEDELAFHLSVSAEAHERQGVSPAEARAQAAARLGDLTRLRAALYRIDHHSLREERRMTWLTDLRHDLRFSLRRIRHRPFLITLVVLTLAIGTATVMTFFGAADQILLRPLPIATPDRVMTLWRAPITNPETRTGLASGTFMDLAEETRLFAALAAAEPYSFDVPNFEDGSARSVSAWRVTEEYFNVLQVTPRYGRLLTASDFVPGGTPTVLVSHRFWATHLRSDPAAIGGTLHLNNVPHLVSGVLPDDFPAAAGGELFTPLVISGTARENRVADYFSTFGLLRPGTDPAAAAAELRELVARSDARITGSQTARELHLVSFTDALLGEVRGGIGLLVVGAMLVLFMAAASAAGLMITDTFDRHRELAIRASIGAGRDRITRQLATEAVILSVIGGGLGFAAGAIGLRLFQRLAPADLPRVAELSVDIRLAGIALIAVLLLALGTGLLPARLVTRTDLHAALKQSNALSGGRAARRTRFLLVGAQVALAAVLLGVGGLLVRSWLTLQAEDLGYRVEGVVAIENHAAWRFHPTPAARVNFGWQAAGHLANRPGVDAAALVSSLPLAGRIGNEQARVLRPDAEVELSVRAVVGTPGVFETLRIPIVQGRGFGPDDRDTGEFVVVVSQATAAAAFPGEDPIGRMIAVSYSGPPIPRRIVGVAADVRFESPAEPAGLAVYLPHAQAPVGSLYYVTRHRAVTAASIATMQQAMVELLPGSALEDAVNLEALLRAATAPRRFAMLLLTAFAAIALALTAVGLFGLLAQTVRARQQELGIRLAVGAWPTALRNMVVREGVWLAGGGLVAGLGLLLLGSGALRNILYGVPAHDPVTIAVVAIVILTIACLASWWPALQATRVDPIRALRRE